MAEISSSYLRNLKFNPNLLNSFHAKFLRNIRLVILLAFLIIVLGIGSYISLPRRLNPEIKIPIVTVVTVLPGAGPKDVESLITIPLEDAINGVKGKSEMNSSSSDSVSVITIQFTSGTDSDKAQQDVKSLVDGVTLPTDAQDPSVKALDFEDQAVWTFQIKTNSDSATLARFADVLEENIKRNSLVDRISVTGLDTQEFQILANPEKVSEYGINPFSLSQNIKSALKSFPGGNVSGTQYSFPIGMDASVNNISDLRNTTLNLNNQVVKLEDIAEISETIKPNIPQSYYSDPHTAPQKVVTFSVFKTRGSDITQAVSSTRTIVNDTLKPYNGLIQLVSIQDLSHEINDQFTDLLANFRDTIILVFITFLLFLGIRQALIACLTIPLTFLSTFTIMHTTGLSINFLSLFSLLLSLGLLLDDTIVIITGVTAYFKTGKFTPEQAGILVWKDFIIPIWSTTITTVWAFLPLLIATGIIGEFIKTIPIVVAATLYSSTAIAVLITLPLMIVILKLRIPRRVKIMGVILGIGILIWIIVALAGANPLFLPILIVYALLLFMTYKIRHTLADRIRNLFSVPQRKRVSSFLSRYAYKSVLDIDVVGKRYKRLIYRIISVKQTRRKVLFAVILFAVFAYLLLPLGFVVNEFFPKSASGTLFVQAELPSGSNLEQTDKQARILADRLRKTEGVTYVSTQVGQGAPTGGFGGSGNGNNVALFTLVLPKVKEQRISSLDIAKKLRKEFEGYKDADITVVEESGGPPAGSDVQIQLLGDDLSVLDSYADKTVSYLKKQQGVVNAQKGVKAGVSKLTFVPNLENMAANGVTADTVGGALRTYTSGLTIDTVKFNENRSEDITFRFTQDNPTPERLSSIQIPVQGSTVPLSSLGDFQLKVNPTQITRHEGKRTITVSAGVSAGFPIVGINQKLENYVKNDLHLAEGYSYQTGGVNEENNKSVQSIFQAMIISAILIFGTMVIQFSSYRQALLIMLTIPIAVSGVFAIFALTGTPLSFPALIGTLSLFGIVVTQGMVLVDRINLNRKSGLETREAIADGAAARLEPIFLGSLTTIVGLVPISLSDPLWRGLGGAIIAGLSCSIFIMLFFIPVVYYMWFGNEKKAIIKQ